MIAIVVLGLLAFSGKGECAITEWTSPEKLPGGNIPNYIMTKAEGYTGDFITFAAKTNAISITAYAIFSQVPDTGIFQIATPADGVLSLAYGKELDYETAQTHVLQVTAVDNTGTTGSVTVTIAVKNVAPAFKFPDVEVEVADATVAGTDVRTFVAVDVGATITYGIISASNTNLDFTISTSGTVSTAKALDAGTTPYYILEITAADNVDIIATGTATLTVCVATCPSTGIRAEGLAAGILCLITLAVAMLK